MGYKAKVQKVERPTNKLYYINIPVALAEVLELTKGEEFEWLVENKNLLVLRRVKAKKSLDLKSPNE